jgi:hypothetical protein
VERRKWQKRYNAVNAAMRRKSGKRKKEELKLLYEMKQSGLRACVVKLFKNTDLLTIMKILSF